MRMATFMMANGKTIKLMASEFTRISTELGMKVNGKKTNSTARDSKLGMTEHHMKEFTLTERSMDKDILCGETKVSTADTLLTIILRVTEFTSGAMDVCMREPGKTTKWRVRAFLHGLMGESTSAAT